MYSRCQRDTEDSTRSGAVLFLCSVFLRREEWRRAGTGFVAGAGAPQREGALCSTTHSCRVVAKHGSMRWCPVPHLPPLQCPTRPEGTHQPLYRSVTLFGKARQRKVARMLPPKVYSKSWCLSRISWPAEGVHRRKVGRSAGGPQVWKHRQGTWGAVEQVLLQDPRRAGRGGEGAAAPASRSPCQPTFAPRRPQQRRVEHAGD